MIKIGYCNYGLELHMEQHPRPRKSFDQYLKILIQRTTLNSALIAVVFIILGISLLYWSNSPNYWIGKEPLLFIVRDIGSLCVVSFVFTLIWELVAKRSFTDELLAKAKISQELSSSGLAQISFESRDIDWVKLLGEATEVDILFSYGRTWRGAYRQEVHKLAKRKNVRLRILLPNPEEQAILDGLSKRFYTPSQTIQERIYEAKQEFTELHQKNLKEGASIEVWYISRDPHYAMYRFDNTVVIYLYPYAPYYTTGTEGPHFIAKRGGSVYSYVSSQFDFLTNSSNRISEKIV